MNLIPDYDKYRGDNPLYPLPKDYDDLTKEGQRQARLSLVLDQKTPARFLRAWDMFRRFYLFPTEPGFFYTERKESPEFHYEMIYDAGRYARNVFAAPRGYAKSVVIGTELPLFLSLTRPYFKIALGTSNDRLMSKQMSKLMKQYEENPFIVEEFGKMKPSRTAPGIWNTHQLDLLSGSSIEGFSVMGRKRGARPQLFIMDDPEYDPESKNTESQTIILEKFENVLFRQILPMLEQGSSIIWIGTIISARSFLYHACYDDEDPRFKAWNRRVYTVGLKEGKPLWESKEDLSFLEYRRNEMGDAAFSAEFENTPATSQERLLNITEDNEYHVIEETIDDEYYKQPLLSDTVVLYNEKKKGDSEKKRKTCKELFPPMYRFITFDYAEGLSQHHDYSCIAVMGLDNLNCLWVLDMWMGRAKRQRLLYMMYKMGAKWNVRALGLEAVGLQGEVVEAMQQFLEDIEMAEVNPDWKPGVVPIKYPSKMSKASRITGLQWRFESGRIKYPGHMKHKFPFDQLYHQTNNFTTDLALLRFDDAIDTVAMHQFMVRTRGSIPKEYGIKNPIARDIAKDKTDIGGINIFSGIDSQDMKGEVLREVFEYMKRKEYNTNRHSSVKPDRLRNKKHRQRRPHVIK